MVTRPPPGFDVRGGMLEPDAFDVTPHPDRFMTLIGRPIGTQAEMILDWMSLLDFRPAGSKALRP